MRLVRALSDFVSDLSQGDPVAIGIAAFFALLMAVVATIWIVDLRKRKKDDKKKGKPPRR